MDNDDKPIGYVLTRREVLALFGAAGVTWLVGCTPTTSSTVTPTATTATTAAATEGTTTTIPGCVVRPEMTEGPYFVDEQLERSDLREDPTTGTVHGGVPVTLTLNILQIANNACTPLSGAIVDIWQCDAEGIYSDIEAQNTTGQKFLRGFQTTDAAGKVAFTTIFPGWYTGRTVHIHVKIRTDASDTAYEFTSQFYFDDTITDTVLGLEPYNARGTRDTTNSNDMHYANGGDQMLLPVTTIEEGYAATFDIALDLSDTETGADDGFDQGGGGGMPGGGPPNGGGPGGAPPS